MIHRRGSEQENKTGGRLVSVECPACACPNGPGSARCMYCGFALPNADARFNHAYFDAIRRFFNGSSGKKKEPALERRVLDHSFDRPNRGRRVFLFSGRQVRGIF